MRLSLAKCWFWKEGKIKKDMEKKMASKNARKNAFRLKKKISDIFPGVGEPLCALAGKMLFWNCGKIDRDLQKLKWHVRMHEKKDVRLDKK